MLTKEILVLDSRTRIDGVVALEMAKYVQENDVYVSCARAWAMLYRDMWLWKVRQN